MIKPTVTATSPANLATGVSVSGGITVVFSEEMAAFSVDNSTFLLTQGSSIVAGTVSYTSGTKTASFIPTAPLQYGTAYNAMIVAAPTGTGVRDLALNSLAANYSWSFTTAHYVPPATSLWDALLWDTDVWQKLHISSLSHYLFVP
jgi:hypothetical protein